MAGGDERRTAGLLVLAWMLLFVPVAGALALSFALTPEELARGSELWPGCTTRALLGVECPTCGLSRAFSALSHGRWRDALEFHRGAPLAYAAWWLIAGASGMGLGRAVASVRSVR